MFKSIRPISFTSKESEPDLGAYHFEVVCGNKLMPLKFLENKFASLSTSGTHCEGCVCCEHYNGGGGLHILYCFTD